jgi:prephenate dehydrogenase
MAIKITIIGTGQIGASIGLALGNHKDLFMRVGHDKNIQAANRAKANGAVDKVDYNLPSSVTGAAIVILALPQDQIHETLQLIASELKEDAILMDTAPLKTEILQWVQELLPPNRYYIGLAPVINPTYMHTTGSGVDSAQVDLFKNGMIGVCFFPDLPGDAVKLVTDFCTLLGAEHMFIDPLELDSMMVLTYVLPQLLAAAYVNSTMGEPGWQDARKLADRPYALLAGPMGESAEASALISQAMIAKTSLVQRIDLLMEKIDQLRQQLVSENDEQFQEQLEQAKQRYEKWLSDRIAANWGTRETQPNVELPSAKEVFTRLVSFGGRRKPKQS